MELDPYITNLRHEFGMAAEAGGEDARALADRLTTALESAARLALLEALSTAADEITRELAPGSVHVRLRGREPTFVVTPPPAESPAEADTPAAALPPTAPEGDEGATARINFRLGESLKSRIEEAAGYAGLSVNSWLVRAAVATLDSADAARSAPPRAARGSQRFSGWVR
ncbi:MAG TPA: hypothetical protein VMA32_17385 [Streptosporangiaceae bacterium]|nr:hypothetical protein [Streptosporangiaceae bacterium]